jgi:hypothetical protein
LEDEIPELWIDEFLLIACRMANGDTDYPIPTKDIEEEMKKRISAYICVYTTPIIGILKRQQLLDNTSNNDTIRVTYRGIYYIGEKKEIPVTSLGILSISDVRKLITGFFDWIYRRSIENKNGRVSMHELEEEYGNRLTQSPIKQLLRVLQQKGSINIDQNNNIIVTQPGRSFSVR